MTHFDRSTITALLEAIDKPAILIGNDYRILATNLLYKENHALPIVERESCCYEISHGYSKPCHEKGEECPLLAVQQGKESFQTVHIHEHSDGNAYCNIQMSPVTNDKGVQVGYLEILEHLPYASHEPATGKLIGQSQPFTTMLGLISRCASTEVSVLILGDSGTGKELVAQAIHHQSKRKHNSFVIVECTGISEQLFESELFGHEKGAFTGATASKKGLVEEADSGTLFLDEIGDVPLNLQVKLLRLLETGTYRRVGSVTPRRSHFRLVCATHKNLKNMISEGSFRADLYYRLATFPLHIPSLLERKTDIPILVQHFLDESEGGANSIEADALELLCQYDYPGNIRELRNIIQQASIMADSTTISKNNLPREIADATTNQIESKQLEYLVAETAQLLLSHNDAQLKSLADIEKEYLEQVIKNNDLPLEAIANQLGISLRTLYRKLQAMGLKPASFK